MYINLDSEDHNLYKRNRDLCAIMLADSAFIQEHDTVTFNKRRIKKGLPQVTPIYTQEDATACLKLFIGVPNEMNSELTRI